MSSISPFIDTLITNQKTLTKAYTEARHRRIRLGNAMVDDVAKAQQGMLELMKTISEKPTEYKDNLTASIETLTKMQTQYLSLIKLMIAEQTDMREELLELNKAMMEGSQESGKAAMAMVKSFSSDNAFTDMLKKSMETMKDTASKMSTAATA